MLQCVAVCCSVLQCVAVCCSVLQCVAVCCAFAQETCVLGEPRRALEKVEDDVAYCMPWSLGDTLCCSVLQRVAICCSVVQFVAMCSLWVILHTAFTWRFSVL